MSDDERLAALVAGVIRALVIDLAASRAELDEGLRINNVQIRFVDRHRPDLFQALKARTIARRAQFEAPS